MYNNDESRDPEFPETSQIRLLFTLNDYNESGYFYIPFFTFLADKLVLWAPSSKWMKAVGSKSRYADDFLLNDRIFYEILTNDNNGHGPDIQLSVRDFWYNEEERNKQRHELLQWDRDSDPKYADLMEKDRVNIPISDLDNKHILIAKREEGRDYAENIINNIDGNSDYRKRYEYARDYVRKVRDLPAEMWREKMNSDLCETDNIRRLLRDAYNTLHAVDQAGCDITHTLNRESMVMMRELSGLSLPERQTRKQVAIEGLYELKIAFDMIKKGKLYFKKPGDFQRALADSHVKGTDYETLRRCLKACVSVKDFTFELTNDNSPLERLDSAFVSIADKYFYRGHCLFTFTSKGINPIHKNDEITTGALVDTTSIKEEIAKLYQSQRNAEEKITYIENKLTQLL